MESLKRTEREDEELPEPKKIKTEETKYTIEELAKKDEEKTYTIEELKTLVYQYESQRALYDKCCEDLEEIIENLESLKQPVNMTTFFHKPGRFMPTPQSIVDALIHTRLSVRAHVTMQEAKARYGGAVA
jgi:hypothetical protein